MGMAEYRIIVTPEFLTTLVRKEFSANEQRRFLRALDLLDEDERHPSLRLHPLQGRLAGQWSASTSDELRITFERMGEGKKRLIACRRHYR